MSNNKLSKVSFLKILFLLLVALIPICSEMVILTGAAVAQDERAETKKLVPVQSVEILGNTVFDDSELEALLAPLIGQKVSLEILLQAQRKIDNYYFERGYLSSGSLLLPQEVEGVIRIQIIEGILEAIQIKGLKNLSENYLKSRLPQVGKPLNAHHLLRSLARLRNDPLIAQIKGDISQVSRGKNILMVDLAENSPILARLTFTNAYSPSIGSSGGNFSLTHLNLLGFGDRLNLNRSQTEGLTRTGGFYSFPINKLDGRIIFAYNNANNELTEDVIADFDINSDYESVRVDFQQPIIFTSTESLILGVGIELIDSETFVLEDFSFAFTKGLEDGRSKITAVRLTQEYTKKGQNSYLAFNSQFNIGIDAFDATKTEVGIDGIYWSWNGDFQWLKAFNQEKDLLLATRIFTQLTPSQLLPIEQFTLGGLAKVMGYRPNLGVADNGVIGTIELRIPLIRSENWGDLQLIPFFHVGNIWNNVRETTGSNTFASSGLALRYRFKEAFEVRLDYGKPIIKARNFGETNTEDNFSVSVLIYPLRF